MKLKTFIIIVIGFVLGMIGIGYLNWVTPFSFGIMNAFGLIKIGELSKT